MKTRILLIGALFLNSGLAGTSLKVAKVGEYEDVEFTSIEYTEGKGDRVTFSHKNGSGKTLLNQLPSDVQKKVLATVTRNGSPPPTADEVNAVKAKQEENVRMINEAREKRNAFEALRNKIVTELLSLESWKILFEEEPELTYWLKYLDKPNQWQEFNGRKFPVYSWKADNGTKGGAHLGVITSETEGAGKIIAVLSDSKILKTKWYIEKEHQKLIPTKLQ